MDRPNSQKSWLYVFLTGLCMGAADVVPGVSGGTMAFLMGIYDQLLSAVKSVDASFAKKLMRFDVRGALSQIPWWFVIPLGGGIGLSVLTLSRVLERILKSPNHHHQEYLMSFFFGLIVASIVALAARVTWSAKSIVALTIGTVFAFWLVGLVPASPGHSPLILFGSGVLAITAMILPGISGAFILLVVGQYEHCVATLNRMIDHLKAGEFSSCAHEFTTTVLPIGAGAVVGLMIFSRILSWLLSKFHEITVATLIGFMVGSLRRIWPYKEILKTKTDHHGEEVPIEWQNVWPTSFDSAIWLAVGCCILGFVVVSLVDHLQDKRNPVIRLILRST